MDILRLPIDNNNKNKDKDINVSTKAKENESESAQEKKATDKIIDYFMELHVASLFMPHGLGHFVGLNVHDVGGYTKEYPAQRDKLGLCWLRTTRKLEAGMFLTVEPGLYFNQAWINDMLSKKEHSMMVQCVNEKKLKEYFDEGIGGCRLEDDVLVTENGIENFTLCPRTCDQIEKVMAMKESDTK